MYLANVVKLLEQQVICRVLICLDNKESYLLSSQKTGIHIPVGGRGSTSCLHPRCTCPFVLMAARCPISQVRENRTALLNGVFQRSLQSTRSIQSVLIMKAKI